MLYDHQFGLFQDDECRPIWRGSFTDLEQAKRQAREFADEERQEFFVCRCEDYSEVARLFPTRNKTVELHRDSTRKIGSATRETK